MDNTARAVPERLTLTAGAMPAAGTLPQPYPFETVAPVHEGYVERDGVRSWYAQFGDSGPWLAFAPIFQIANTHVLKGVVPYLAQHFRVVVMDLRGNGKSDRPKAPEAYTFDHYFADFVAVTLPLIDVVLSRSTTRLCLTGPRASFLRTSSG